MTMVCGAVRCTCHLCTSAGRTEHPLSAEGFVCVTEPLDAVAWCLSVQHALLRADWPGALSGHRAAAISLAPDADGASLLPDMPCGTCLTPA